MTHGIAPPGTRLRAGIGYDAHRLERGLPLTLGGVSIAHDRGPLAHSDGDVIAHAIGDALLGAASLGDLGDHFPSSDPAWRGVSSLVLLEHIRALLEARGHHIVNVDATLIAEAPRIRPHVERMRDALARTLRIESERVSVKATTHEGLGALGREEGIAAHAVALIEVGGSR